MQNIEAQSPQELLKYLRAIDISVPGRTEGRTKEQCETYSMCRLLSSIAGVGYLHFPLKIKND